MTRSYRDLLRGYSAAMRSVGHSDTAAAALRSRSKVLVDVIAYVASHEKYTVRDLRIRLEEGVLSDTDFRAVWLAALGRVVALQAYQDTDQERFEEDTTFGLQCLEIANSMLTKDQEHRQFHRLQIELLASQGRHNEALDLIEDNEFLKEFYYGYLLADLANPIFSGTTETYDDWLEGFNKPFTENGLLPIKRSASPKHTFNELETVQPSLQNDGPKVSVIMTSYQPQDDTFLLAVRSILNQSWQNLELIIVDDASPAQYKNVLTETKNLDPRVSVIELPVNGGTYRARNIGIAAAKGDLITGQDSDDWSHPERLAHQIAHMRENPSSPGVVVEAIRTDEDLVRMFPGRIPHRACEVSLMLRAELAREVGGYVEARKGADSEFRRRVESYRGQEIHGIEKPLYLIRIGHESLSRADFKPGWSHPVRRAFWNASQHWHDTTLPSKLRASETEDALIPVPNKFKVSPPEHAPEFDTVFVGDWRAYGGTQRAMIDEITLLREHGQRVGVMHIESPLSPSKETTRLSFEIQDLINNGLVDEVIVDEHAKTDVVVVHDPAILQFSPLNGINLVSRVTLVAPDQPPDNADDVWYLPVDCDQNADLLFGGNVVWTSTDPAVRRQLTAYQDTITVDTVEMPIVFQPRNWWNTRAKFSGQRPVIGRHAENNPSLWPQDIEVTNQLWPCEGEYDVAILGDARPYLRKYSERLYPVDWVVFRDSEVRPEAFMSGLDFFVYFPEEEYAQAFCREALEASASGALVVLPQQFEETHGEGAIYAVPENVPAIIDHYVHATDEHSQKAHANYRRLETNSIDSAYFEYMRSLTSTYISSGRTISESNA